MLTSDTKQKFMKVALISAFISLAFCFNVAAIIYNVHNTLKNSQIDFLGIYSFANFIAHHNPESIYQQHIILSYEKELLPNLKSTFYFPYPPTFFIIIFWMKYFSDNISYYIWNIVGFILLVHSIYFLIPKNKVFSTIIIICGSASFLVNATNGETGFYTSAALIYGCAFLKNKPILSGIAFGLLSIKPQLGVMIPFMLLGLMAWRTILSIFITFIILALISIKWFGINMWKFCISGILNYQHAQTFSKEGITNMISIESNFIRLGVSYTIANEIQLLFFVGSAILTFMMFRKAPYRLAVAAFMVATFIATPHSYTYDAIPLIIAIIILTEFCGISWILMGIGQ